MDLQLAGDVAVVFGAASGLGRAIAAAFAAEGARVVLADVSPTVAEVARELGGDRAEVVDVTDFAAVRTCRRARRGGRSRRLRRRGRVGQVRLPVLEPRPGRLGPRAAGEPDRGGERRPRLRPGDGRGRDAGRCCSSRRSPGRSARRPTRRTAPSKAALINFAQCAAKDLAPFGVRVNTLCPGMVQTPLNRSVWQAWADRQPPEERQAYEEWAAEKIAKARAARPLADAGGRRGDGGLPGLAAGRERHRPDDQRGRRVRHALVTDHPPPSPNHAVSPRTGSGDVRRASTAVAAEATDDRVRGPGWSATSSGRPPRGTPDGPDQERVRPGRR